MSLQDLQIASLGPWIGKLARRWRVRYLHRLPGLELEDLVQAGNLGALKALPGWNPELGAWITYATPWVEEYIRRECEQLLLKGVGSRKLYRQTRYVPLVQQLPDEGLEAPTTTVESRMWLRRLIAEAGLNAKELLVLERCELREESFQALGTELGVTRERVRQIHEKAIRKLREVAL